MPGPALIIEKGRQKGKGCRLRKNSTVVVGRDLSCTLRLSDEMASRRHFEITGKLDEWTLRDLDSSNGTILNGERVTGEHTLRFDDRVLVGQTLLSFVREVALAKRGKLTGKEVAGYRVGNRIGRGGMGTVYEAVQVSLDRTVALKVLADELVRDDVFIDKFIKEARAAGRLNHPNLVQVYDVGHEEKVFFFSMEYVTRGSVCDLLRKERRLSVAGALPMVLDAARGLEYAERKGIVHRDIKPDNLMISEDWMVKIGDLGIAQQTSGDGSALQEEDGVSGSPHYIAPEQALGKPIDTRADIYALGISFHEMLSGEPPFQGSTMRQIILKHVQETVPLIRSVVPDVPEDVSAVIDRMVKRDPEGRHRHASDLVQDLTQLCQRYPVRESQRMRLPLDLRSEPDPALLISSVEEPGGNAGSPAAPQLPGHGITPAPLSPPLPPPPQSDAPPDQAGPGEPSPPGHPGNGTSSLVTIASIAAVLFLAGLSAFGAYRFAQRQRDRQRQNLADNKTLKTTIIRLITEGQEAKAVELATDFFKREGLDDPWRAQAETLLKDAQHALKRKHDLKREQTAQKAYDLIMKQTGGLTSLDLGQLRKIKDSLDRISSDYPETNAGRQAADQSLKLANRIDRKTTEAEANLRDLQDQRKHWESLQRKLEPLTQENRYGELIAGVAKQHQQIKERFPGLAAELTSYMAAMRTDARTRTDNVIKSGRQLIAEEQLDEAISMLDTFADRIGLAANEKRARTLARSARARKQTLADDRQRAVLDEDMKRIAEAWDSKRLGTYAFESVRDDLARLADEMQTTTGKARCRERRQQCKAAMASRDRLVNHINQQARPIITITYAERPFDATSASLAKGLTFSARKGSIERYFNFNELEPKDIVNWCSRIPGFDELEAYRLASMLTLAGNREDAKDVLRRIERTSDAGLRSRVNALLDELSR